MKSFIQRVIVLVSLCCVVSVIESRAQLVLPGDHPDPSVAEINGAYWASATSSNWAPAFPLLVSDDLIHWTLRGHVFPELPQWADYYFWAPEISYDSGKVYVYYSAHKKEGNLCLGVATAEKPEGPYTDLGPIMCQEVGSIDAFPMRDENGKLFLIWKEDANSVGKPTPIWMSEMKEDRTGLIGEKVELFRNDAAWESNLVEGVAMIRHGEYIYAFYAGAGCCGRDCTYATGIARSRKLAGPWEKFPGNPVMKSDDEWICPGHGTPIEKDGKYYFLYHAYDKKAGVFFGRQGLVREFEFTSDGWIRFLPDSQADIKPSTVRDEFDSTKLHALWQWSVFKQPDFDLRDGSLILSGDARDWDFLAQKPYEANYRARIKVNVGESSAQAGIAAIGDEKNIVGATVDKSKITLWKRRLGKDTVLLEETVAPGKFLFLEMKVEDGHRITFRCSTNGKSYREINRRPIDGAFLPPWDRPVRVGIIAKDGEAVFENFILYH